MTDGRVAPGLAPRGRELHLEELGWGQRRNLGLLLIAVRWHCGALGGGFPEVERVSGLNVGGEDRV